MEPSVNIIVKTNQPLLGHPVAILCNPKVCISFVNEIGTESRNLNWYMGAPGTLQYDKVLHFNIEWNSNP